MSSKNRELNVTHSTISSLLIGFKAHITVGDNASNAPWASTKEKWGCKLVAPCMAVSSEQPAGNYCRGH